MEPPGKWKRGRPKRRFVDAVREDVAVAEVTEEDAEDRTEWRWKTGSDATLWDKPIEEGYGRKTIAARCLRPHKGHGLLREIRLSRTTRGRWIRLTERDMVVTNHEGKMPLQSCHTRSSDSSIQGIRLTERDTVVTNHEGKMPLTQQSCHTRSSDSSIQGIRLTERDMVVTNHEGKMPLQSCHTRSSDSSLQGIRLTERDMVVTNHEGKMPLQSCHTRSSDSSPRVSSVATRNHVSAPDSWTHRDGSAKTRVSMTPSDPTMSMVTVAEVPALRCHPVITVTR